jgi:hypothetical protein
VKPQFACERQSGADASLTEVRLTWIEGRCEHMLRFGRVADDRTVGEDSRIVSFRPGAVFALVRRISSDFGPTCCSLSVVQAAETGQISAPVASVIAGGERLLHVEDLAHISQVLEMVDAMEADGIDPCDASPDHWRDVAARLNDGRQIRPYTRARHAAWLQRSRTGR